MKIYLAGNGHEIKTDFMKRERVKGFMLTYHYFLYTRFGLVKKIK
jgi:hypothetical protein